MKRFRQVLQVLVVSFLANLVCAQVIMDAYTSTAKRLVGEPVWVDYTVAAMLPFTGFLSLGGYSRSRLDLGGILRAAHGTGARRGNWQVIAGRSPRQEGTNHLLRPVHIQQSKHGGLFAAT